MPNLEPALIPAVLFLWPATKSLVFMGAAAVNLFSRKPGRRAEARRLLRLLAPPQTNAE
ncbi:hypothetical protein AB0F81_10550 [Actinoplanes sp. NPDC024001]|uniref:hypothetical protein n=1 Tax=Actinoplanes sp. NPDC024001 TaxID=3154598 RepID=UPI0033D67498